MKQTHLFDLDCIRFDVPDAELIYIPEFISFDQADGCLETLKQTLSWSQDEITLYGKSVTIPRLQAWHGDAEAEYRYSNLSMRPQGWTPMLYELKQACEAYLCCTFNSVLGNWYRDGQDSMGMHSDNEPELGPHPTIAALSFGQTRRLKFRHRNKRDRLNIDMQSGSLLVMSGSTQRFWQHGIAKSVKPMQERMSLTFRHIFSRTNYT
ncbi:alpha-ketoglutarate-dependent dioxygenase AlkB family protein [Alteromonas sp. a30]|uniref:alpha-ketoglutarate-dependent dioxygenase AlkB family protein n=1 Tax=Alteromonas sp. a30 TaxID=2730917 RepID=UPI00227FFFB2|nr:alpha-ketoglutarate-dependent dioxygenase AlkB [Alteromonas sp. a30]MCY7296192.1 alpha-ketoglutarate-dependent dioxygenase AlkB [Alteromonas sp. a30]